MNRRGFLKSVGAFAAIPFVPKLPLAETPWYYVYEAPYSGFVDVASYSEAPLTGLFKGELGRYENVRFIEPR